MDNIPVFDPNQIIQKVKDNYQKLDICDLHDFSIDLTPEKKFAKRYQCTKCGGEIGSSEKYWYEKGLKHASQKEGDTYGKS